MSTLPSVRWRALERFVLAVERPALAVERRRDDEDLDADECRLAT